MASVPVTSLPTSLLEEQARGKRRIWCLTADSREQGEAPIYGTHQVL